jgi:hypothetical protein
MINVGLFTPERKIKEVSSFVSPLTGLYPGHNTPSPTKIDKNDLKGVKSAIRSFPSLTSVSTR